MLVLFTEGGDGAKVGVGGNYRRVRGEVGVVCGGGRCMEYERQGCCAENG